MQKLFLGRTHQSLSDSLRNAAPGYAMVTTEQTHRAVCRVVTTSADQCVLAADAIITNLPQVALAVRVADCLPVLISHPQGVIAAIHAGRKGTEQGVLQHTLQVLKTVYGLREGLEVWFGPCICETCYQVDRKTDEHYGLIEKNQHQLWQEFSPNQVQLSIDGRCTCHQPNEFYSYRREGSGVKMNYAGVWR